MDLEAHEFHQTMKEPEREKERERGSQKIESALKEVLDETTKIVERLERKVVGTRDGLRISWIWKSKK